MIVAIGVETVGAHADLGSRAALLGTASALVRFAATRVGYDA